MKHISTFEGFLNESKRINEGYEDAQGYAEDWEAETMDPDDIVTTAKQTDEVSKWITSSIAKMGGPKNQYYLITKYMVQDNSGLKSSGLKWPLFLKLVKDVKYEETKIDGDHIILFCDK